MENENFLQSRQGTTKGLDPAYGRKKMAFTMVAIMS